jgi:hypothetical protein
MVVCMRHCFIGKGYIFGRGRKSINASELDATVPRHNRILAHASSANARNADEFTRTCLYHNSGLSNVYFDCLQVVLGTFLTALGTFIVDFS